MDPIADMLTRIRNGFLARKAEVIVPSSHVKQALADILVAEGYIERVELIGVDAMPWSPRTSRRAAHRGRTDILRLVLKYETNGTPSMSGLDRISKPSRRVYVKKQDIPMVRSGLGTAILSTSRGLMTSRQAKRLGVGGELICRVY